MGKTLIILLSVLCLALLLASLNTALVRSDYAVESARLPKAFDGFRIAQVSDLHNAEFGRGNARLLALLREAEPDLIALTGDLVDSRRTDYDAALRFLEAAMEIAPCYYVPGNHEARLEGYFAFVEDMEARGVVVLEGESVALERAGERITLLGVRDPAFHGEARFREDVAALAGEGYRILLSHRPEYLELYAEAGVDLVLAGHAHGGQIRLPGLGGLFAPGQGFFPEYDAGLYREGHTALLVSRGLGNSLFPLRIFNRPELVLVELKP